MLTGRTVERVARRTARSETLAALDGEVVAGRPRGRRRRNRARHPLARGQRPRRLAAASRSTSHGRTGDPPACSPPVTRRRRSTAASAATCRARTGRPRAGRQRRAARVMLGLDPGEAPLTSFWTDQYGLRIQYVGDSRTRRLGRDRRRSRRPKLHRHLHPRRTRSRRAARQPATFTAGGTQVQSRKEDDELLRRNRRGRVRSARRLRRRRARRVRARRRRASDRRPAPTRCCLRRPRPVRARRSGSSTSAPTSRSTRDLRIVAPY